MDPDTLRFQGDGLVLSMLSARRMLALLGAVLVSLVAWAPLQLVGQAPASHSSARQDVASLDATGCNRAVRNLQPGHPAARSGAVPIYGISSPATVAASIAARADPGPNAIGVVYFIDNSEVWRVTQPPFYLGPVHAGSPVGFRLDSVPSGLHTLTGCAILPAGRTAVSDPIQLTIVPDINREFSRTLAPYRIQPSAQQSPLEVLLAHTSTEGAKMTPDESAIRRRVMAMYVNWGIDPSFDFDHDQSDALQRQSPGGAAQPPPHEAGTPPSMWFFPDAPFYHPIPPQWPRVALPRGYFKTIQLNEAHNGDGIGFGEVIATPGDPELPVRSQWDNVSSTLRTFGFRMPSNWPSHLPTHAAGDLHVVFIDPVKNTFISSYKTSADPSTGGPDGLYITSPQPLAGLGDKGGSNAAGFADLPVLLQPGEATNPAQDIPHAIGGSVRRTWAARVFPAHSWDTGVRTSVDACSHKGFTNTGLIPYGGVIQLDPSLDLSSMGLSLPARRILRAMQVYGYYVMDYGCTDLDIYTAIDAAELDPFGGPWGNANGPGVQNELRRVLSRSVFSVVPPMSKR